MNKFLTKINGRTAVGSAAALISFSYLISRVLGLIRDRLLVAHFGVGPLTDAYNAAFRLPELLFTLLVSGALAVAFIPVLTEHLEKDEQDVASEITSSILNLLVIGTVVVAGIIFIFAGQFTTLVAPGFNAYSHHLTMELTRIMLLTPVLFAISSVLGSTQQAYGRFVVYALASVFYNLGIVFGILFLAPTHSIYGVAWGVVIGAGAQAALQVFGMIGLGYRYQPILKVKLKGVQQTVKLMIPRSIDQGVDQINYIVETIIGSRLSEGSITAYSIANNLKNVPVSLFATAITTAIFPSLARSAARGERQTLIEDFVRTARLILFLAIPSAVMAVILRGYIVRLLFGFGNPATSQTLGWLAGTIIFQSLFMLIVRIYFAMQDTKTPLYVSFFSVGLNVIFSLILSHRFGVEGLAMAASLVAMFETVTLAIILHRRLGNIGERQIMQGVISMLGAGSVMALALYWTVSQILPLYSQDKGILIVGPKFFALAIIGVVAYLVPSYTLRIREARYFVGRVRDTMANNQTLN